MESAVRLDVLQRPQAEPDEPPTGAEREDDGAGRDRELDEEQGVQRAGLVDQGLRLHEHVAVEVAADDLGRPHPERRTPRGDGARGELGHLGPVRLRGEAADGRGQLGAVGVVPNVGGALEGLDDPAALARRRRCS